LTPPPGAPAAWVTEGVQAIPRNIYGVTKTAAEDLCELFHRARGLPCLVLRTSHFFPEEDDNPALRQAYGDDNVNVNEFLYRRVNLGCGRRTFARHGKGPVDWLRSIHHQRNHAFSSR
jgi:UDP-glucose 4-epimerase